MPNVWRIRLKSGASGVDHEAARTFAVTNGIVGAGWGLNGSEQHKYVPDGCPDIEKYLRHAKIVFPNNIGLTRAAAIYGNRMEIGDFCWMYFTGTGDYWCGRIDGNFAYRVGGAFDLYDLHMTRHCTWARAGTADAVPGVITRALARPFGAVSAIKADADSAVKAAEKLLSKPIGTQVQF